MDSTIRINISIIVILITWFGTHQGEASVIERSNELKTGMCHIYGGPHLVMFPHRSIHQQPFRSCKAKGEHLIYKNEWIRFTITVPKSPFSEEQYKMIFSDGNEKLCTIDSIHNLCNHPKIQINTLNSSTEITYRAASLRITIARFTTTPYYDIVIYQTNFTIIDQSNGVCVDESINCEIERPVVSAINKIISDTTSPTHQDKGICHFYGDPHVIPFSQRSEMSQDQYWCKISGEHQILKNDYIQITAHMHDRTWLVDKFVITFSKDSNTVLCTITDNEQTCQDSEIRITRPSQLQIDILYITPQLHISIVLHEYQLRWYDISVRMPYELIRLSNGLCIMSSVDNCQIENSIEQIDNTVNSLARQICEQYVAASNRGSIELNISIDLERFNNALIACIHDYETTNNKNVGASIVNMIIKHGINRQQLEDVEFELQTIKSIDIIDNAVMNASIQTDILLDTTTTTTTSSTRTTMSSNLTPTTTSSTRTTMSSSLTPTTTSNHSIAAKTNNIHLILLLFYFLLTSI